MTPAVPVSFLFAFVILAASVLAQQAAPRPVWDEDPSVGGLSCFTTAVPAAVPVAHAGRLAAQFPGRGWALDLMQATFEFSPTSGVLSIVDKRPPSGPVAAGWDTGFAKVLSITRLTDDANGSAILATVWDATASVSRVVKISIAAGGSKAQATIPVASASGSVWVAPSFVDGRLYVADVATMHLRRAIDTDADGNVDAMDATFVVPLPTSFFGATMTDVALIDCLPIGGFYRAAGEVVTLQPRPGASVDMESGRVKVFATAGGRHELRLQRTPAAVARLGLSLSCLTAGQNAVLVTGSVGASFVVQTMTGPDRFADISPESTIRADGTCLVLLSRPLISKEKIRAFSAGEDVATAWFEVLPALRAVRQGR